MPPATSYPTPNTPEKEQRALRESAESERRSRAALYETGWAYYDGTHPRPLKVTDEGIDNNVIINKAGEAIDQTIAFLLPDMPVISLVSDGDKNPQPVEPPQPPQPPQATEPGQPPEPPQFQPPAPPEPPEVDEAEVWLQAAWDYNGGPAALIDIALMGSIMGHNYIRMIPPRPGEDFPRFAVLDGDRVISYWLAGDRDTVLWHEVYYKYGKSHRRLDFINLGGLNPEVMGWQIAEYEKRANRWELLGIQKWAYETAPIINWKHLPQPRSFYGRSELTHLGLNDSINKVASDIKAILRIHASPKTIGTGFTADELQETAVDSFWTVEDEAAKVYNLEMASDLASSMAFLDLLKTAYEDQAKVTSLKGGPEAYKNITNLGIKAAFMRMIAKNNVLKSLYGRGIKAISEALLELGSKVTDKDVEVVWPNALPLSELEQTQVIQLQRDMKLLSKETAANELGIDYDKEQQKLYSEGNQDDTAALMEKLLMGQRGPDQGSPFGN